jgi:hypothetical protein
MGKKIIDEARFMAVQASDGTAWYVIVALPNGVTRRVDGFTTEQDAREWIRRDSSAWLKRIEGGKFA